MNTKKSIPKKPSLDELVFGALSQLQMLGYSGRAIRRYQSTWKRLIAFAKKQKSKNKISEKLILDFLAHYGIEPNSPTSDYKGWRRHAEYSLKILWNYARFGYFERCKTILAKLNVPTAMQKTLNEYKKYCEEKCYLCQYTINERLRAVGLLLDFLGKRHIETFKQIRAANILDFVYTLSRFSAKTISSEVSHLRMFLKYIFVRGRVKTDLSRALPSVSVPYQGKIPSVWDKKLMVKLLDAVDRSSPMGKRDYAILLLACRLGLRLSDIAALTLDHINWEAETISITQVKTKRPLCLPLTGEVGDALIDYIKFSRPKSNYRQLFLRLTSPFTPLNNKNNYYHMMRYWRTRAGIHFRTKQRQGVHSLRHSLATYLLEENTSFSVIADILGHASLNTTMIYARSSVETLRQAALSLKEVDHVN